MDYKSQQSRASQPLMADKAKGRCLQVMHLYETSDTVIHSSLLFLAFAHLCDARQQSTMHHVKEI